MKIATVTFHRAANYGAVLQAYALQQAIKLRNPDCEVGVLDHCNEVIEKRYKPFYLKGKKGAKSLVRAFATVPMRYKKRKAFRTFVNGRLNLIPFSSDEEKKQALESVDRFVAGSDQIWNFDLSGWDKTYLLDFVDDNSKKYAYAPSIGKTQLNEKEKSTLKSLNTFAGISAREESAAQLIFDVTQKKPEIVPDPVFLLDKEDWRKIEKKPADDIPQKYVLIYRFIVKADDGNRIMQFAKQYAEKYGCKIVMLQDTLKKFNGVNVIKSVAPDEFVWLIDHAQCVVTNSFHGTAFSVLFGKQFFSEANVVRGTRIKEILLLYGLEDHLLTENKKASELDTDWDKVNAKVSQYRAGAFEYIDSIISD